MQFGLVRLTKNIYLIVEKGVLPYQYGFPKVTPFQTYGVISTMQGFPEIITYSPEVDILEEDLVQLVLSDIQ